MDARRAGRHAGEAGQAAVDMLDHLPARRLALLQHVLDEIDAPARRIVLVAEQEIGRAGRRAEAAMHTGAQDLLGLGGIGIGKLGEGERGLHGYRPAHIRPGLSTPLGSKLSLTRRVSAPSGPAGGSNTSIAAPEDARPPPRGAWPPTS